LIQRLGLPQVPTPYEAGIGLRLVLPQLENIFEISKEKDY